VLFNVWDAGSAQAVTAAGAKAIATSSWSVAHANGFADGEQLPLPFAIENLRRIVAATNAADQAVRIRSARRASETAELAFFINARTDVFFQRRPAKQDEEMVTEVLERAKRYRDAGADGNFARDPVRTIALTAGSPLCKPTQSPEPAHGIADNQFCSQSRLSLRGS
jgi:2-methylisocitrate lyase-like PEP mutase family enzyme